MDPILMLLARLLPGFDISRLEGLAVKEAHDLLRGEVAKRWNTAAPSIAAAMKAAGRDYHWTTTERSQPPAAYVADIQFRLWKKAIRWGPLADAFRDTHAEKILAAVAPQIGPGGDTEHDVRAVINSEIALTF